MENVLDKKPPFIMTRKMNLSDPDRKMALKMALEIGLDKLNKEKDILIANKLYEKQNYKS